METTQMLLALVLAVNGLQLFILRDLLARLRHLELRAMGDTPATVPGEKHANPYGWRPAP